MKLILQHTRFKYPKRSELEFGKDATDSNEQFEYKKGQNRIEGKTT